MRLTHASLLNPHFACIDREDHGRYHLFTDGIDPNADPHDHAEWGFWSKVVVGGYVEEVFFLDEPQRREIIYRREGDEFRVETNHIHRMLRLIGPVCVTHVAPDVHSPDPHAWAYQFRDDGVYRRPIFGHFENLEWHKIR